MNQEQRLEVGFDVPAVVGMSLEEIQTPALIVDLDAFERNVKTMSALAGKMGMTHRAHAKTHKSVDIARIQMELGGAVGVCCQKVSEAEVMRRGGIRDILVSNQVVDPVKIDRLARMAKEARIQVCVDDINNIQALSRSASQHGVIIECLVEIDCGSGRCGVQPGPDVVILAENIRDADGLNFMGLQAYAGSAQHIRQFEDRRAAIEEAVGQVKMCQELLNAAGLDAAIVSGAGTGSYYFEGASGVYTELQCGSYVFMDADYQQVLDEQGKGIHEFENSLFILTSVMSKAKADKAICDAGLKVQSVDSGLPVIYQQHDLVYTKCTDEHGEISDPDNRLKLNDKLLLIPGHCDPTCNIHDWYVGVRNETVEALWPVSARGKAF